jgi:hypothetical protein
MDPSNTRRLVTERTLWIGGAQWAGKTTVAQILAMRHGLVHYSYDYHDARAHVTKAMSRPDRYPHRATIRSADDEWVETSPRGMAQRALQSFQERFTMVLEELATLPGSTSILAEGWGLRPDLVQPHLRSPRQAIFLVPSDAFREQQLRDLSRARAFPADLGVSDPDRAQQNRIARDILLAREVVDSAARLNLRVITVDGSMPPERIALLVEEHFRPHLEPWLY